MKPSTEIRCASFLTTLGTSYDDLSEPARQAVATALDAVQRTSRNAEPFPDRDAVAEKIDWEGGIFEALGYGIHAEDMPDAQLRELWELLEASFRITQSLADTVMELLTGERS